MLKINTIFLFLIIFTLNSFAQLTKEEYNSKMESLTLQKKELNNEIETLKSEIDSLQNLIPDLEQQVRTEFRELYVLKYGKKTGNRVSNKQIWKGMSDKMVRDGWGKPDKIDRNVEKWGVFEQWSYGSITFFFKDGRLTDWEDKEKK